MAKSVSILYSQLGYYSDGEKQAFLRFTEEAPLLAEDTVFTLEDEKNQIVFTGTVQNYGKIWKSQWYTLDFTAFRGEGYFHIRCGAYETETFALNRRVLSGKSLKTIAMEQLDAREKPEIGGWRDCGSEIRELSSMVITTNALIDLYENETILPYAREELMQKILHGADAIVYSQEKWPDDPEKDGRFNHDAFRMTDYGTTDYHNWHDTAFAITGLVRASEAVKHAAPERARVYLKAAIKAYENAVRRPYNLERDIDSRDHPFIPYDDHFRPFIDQIGRLIYHRDAEWHMPTTLRTKDKMTFTYACTLLHRATGDPRYLETAIAFADKVCERQCLDEKQRDNGFGFFHEFEDDDDSYLLEFCHHHKFYMGNIEPANLMGLSYLVKNLPFSERTVKYLRAIFAYTEGYVKRTAKLTPLSIYPQTVYNGNLPGVRFFEIAVHGFTCLYGEIAHNLIELADFLEDETLARLAERNLMFPLGRNPGFADAFVPTCWKCNSLFKGIGHTSFGGVHSLSVIPEGSGMNGFITRQFDCDTPLEEMPDEPLGIWQAEGQLWFNEDYLPHSHGYVSAVALRERDFRAHIQLLRDGEPVETELTLAWEDGDPVTVRTGADGCITFRKGTMYQKGTLSLDGKVLLAFESLPGASLNRKLDLGALLTLTADVGEASVTFRLENRGDGMACGKLRAASSGVQLGGFDGFYALAAGETCEITVPASAFEPVYAVSAKAGGQQIVLFRGADQNLYVKEVRV